MATINMCRLFFKACCDVLLKKKKANIIVFMYSSLLQTVAKVRMVLLSDSLLIHKPSYDL